MDSKILKYTVAIILAVIMASCGGTDRVEPVRSVYYWNTTFDIDSLKRDFIREHGIKRMYVRYFDVVADASGGFPHPNATIRIDSVPDMPGLEIVPVVFVLPDALDTDRHRLAELVMRRVRQMSGTHGMGQVREVQIDCDWTVSTRGRFYDFMRILKEMTAAEGITLSSTIRLHQLSDTPPPADKGVLMVYNTGDMRDLGKEKPILDIQDVEPYLKYIRDYPLPLASAYPIYRWELLFRNGKFVDIVHDASDVPVLRSDTLVVREPAADDILVCRRAIEMRRPDCAAEIILFDLNNYNIRRYESERFEDFYN